MVGVVFFLSNQVMGALRDRHPEVWDRLGKPTLILNNSIQNSLALQKFLRSDELRELGDDKLTMSAGRLRTVTYVYFALFAFMMITAVFQGAESK